MASLMEHALEQLLDLAPIVVEPLEQKLCIRRKRLVVFGVDEGAARGVPVELVGSVRDDQRASGSGGDWQLAREPKIECIDRLDSQPPRIVDQIPTARVGTL